MSSSWFTILDYIEDEESLKELTKSLDRLADKSEGILLGGDFNLPGWNWKDKQLKEDCKYPSLHSMFGEMLDDRFLTQVIELPTRENNCLDLICTNTPTKILNTDVIPGISDHDIPLVELDVRPVRRRQRPRKIHLYK